MIIFACDSTAVIASVALCDGEKLLAEFTLNNGNTHSETLLPMTEAILSRLGMTPADIGLFACSAGPGSFTGVRIGVATVKGLAYGRGKPCVGVSSLEALSLNHKGLHPDGTLVCPVMDARRNQLYNALFEIKDGRPERLTPDRAVSAASLASELAGLGRRTAVCGDGSAILLGALGGLRDGPETVFSDRLGFQSAYSVALAALRAYERGEAVDDAALRPVYLRPPQAERERLERLARAAQTKGE